MVNPEIFEASDAFKTFDVDDTELMAGAHEAYGRAINAMKSPHGPDAPDERRLSPSYWVVCTPRERLPDPSEVLCVTGGRGEGIEDGAGARRALAVFSFREEAEAFRRLRSRGRGLRIRELDGGELISVLYGQWGGLGRVALDPVPEAEHHVADRLVIVSREEFVKLLVSRVRFPVPSPPGGPTGVA
ncbi:hypothetical protein [Rubrobacter aplysinae]|uniref:hypothetical protein n=1 Tax=Rubrobacter aplysinae TaxID=909625 RepID=UPI00064C310D|nr:hypothetical protein [Rubrobacter aplysinae]